MEEKISTIHIDDVGGEGDSSSPPLCYYRLCCAVLFKALEDVEFYDAKCKVTEDDAGTRQYYAKTAYDWLFNDTDAPLTLSFICDQLRLTKEEVREKAVEIIIGKLSVRQASSLKPSIK